MKHVVSRSFFFGVHNAVLPPPRCSECLQVRPACSKGIERANHASKHTKKKPSKTKKPRRAEARESVHTRYDFGAHNPFPWKKREKVQFLSNPKSHDSLRDTCQFAHFLLSGLYDQFYGFFRSYKYEKHVFKSFESIEYCGEYQVQCKSINGHTKKNTSTTQSELVAARWLM